MSLGLGRKQEIETGNDGRPRFRYLAAHCTRVYVVRVLSWRVKERISPPSLVGEITIFTNENRSIDQRSFLPLRISMRSPRVGYDVVVIIMYTKYVMLLA